MPKPSPSHKFTPYIDTVFLLQIWKFSNNLLPTRLVSVLTFYFVQFRSFIFLVFMFIFQMICQLLFYGTRKRKLSKFMWKLELGLLSNAMFSRKMSRWVSPILQRQKAIFQKLSILTFYELNLNWIPTSPIPKRFNYGGMNNFRQDIFFFFSKFKSLIRNSPRIF